MFEINTFLAHDRRDEQRANSAAKIYKVRMTGIQLFKLGSPVPHIVDGECIELVVPVELHMDQTGTTIFYKKVPAMLSKKTAEAYETLYNLTTEGVNAPVRRDSQRDRTGMDGAMRLMSGSNRDINQIRRDHHDDFGFMDDYED